MLSDNFLEVHTKKKTVDRNGTIFFFGWNDRKASMLFFSWWMKGSEPVEAAKDRSFAQTSHLYKHTYFSLHM